MRHVKSGALLVLSFSLIVILFFGASSPAYSAGKPIELSYATILPAVYPFTQALEGWGKEIEKHTQGRVKITYYHGATLTGAQNAYEGVVTGISDIALAMLSWSPGRFPLMEVCDLPGFDFNAIAISRAYNDLYRKFRPKEFDDVHVLYLFGSTPGTYQTKKPLRTLGDFKGSRLRCVGISCNVVEALGGTPVAMPKTEQYDALQKGIVDGAVGNPNELKYWRFTEVVKYTTIYPKVGYLSIASIVMNKKKWDSLPPDIKEIFNQVSKEWEEYIGTAMNGMEMEGITYGKEKGHTFITLSREEGARWEKALEPLHNDYVKRMASKGLPGKEALEYRNQVVEKYSKMYPAIYKFE